MPLPNIELAFERLGQHESAAPAGEPGELCIRGPNVFKGYWKNPEATAAAMTADGYFRTGDVARMDDDGFVFIVDRTKDMLLCGGFNVYPRVIEEAIYEHPAVEEVCVIGVPDAYRGQSPKALRQAAPGRRGADARGAPGVPPKPHRQARDGAGARAPRRAAQVAGGQAAQEDAGRRGSAQTHGLATVEWPHADPPTPDRPRLRRRAARLSPRLRGGVAARIRRRAGRARPPGLLADGTAGK